jgi:large subunit ribosomal protein L4
MLTRATSAIRLRALSSFLRQVRPSSSSGKSSDISILPDEEEGQDDFVEVPTKRRMGEPLYHNRDDFWSRYPQVNPAAARETWVEDLSTVGDDNSNELLRLHPDVWSIRPRLDIIYSNVEWQKWYKKVDYEYVKDRYEMDYFSRRRPWPQKGMGKARHATSTSPIWIQGGKAHGNKGPKSYFHMKNYSLRVWGLIHTLSAKYAQDDVKIVKDLEIPSDDPKYIEDLIDKRG